MKLGCFILFILVPVLHCYKALMRTLLWRPLIRGARGKKYMWLVLALKESYRHHLLGIERDIIGLHFGKVWAGLEVI